MTVKNTEDGLTVSPKIFLGYMRAAGLEENDDALNDPSLKISVNEELRDLILNRFKLESEEPNFYDRKTDKNFQDENLKFAYYKEVKGGKETGRVLSVGFVTVQFGGTKEIEYAVSICCPEPCMKERNGKLKKCKGDRFDRKVAKKIISNRIKTGMASHRTAFLPGIRLEQIVMQDIASYHPWDSARRLAKQWLQIPRPTKLDKKEIHLGIDPTVHMGVFSDD